MPIYEYQCPMCGHQLETLQSISEASLTHCTACGKDTLQKKISAAGFQLKGTGWYETDFKGTPKTSEDKKSAKEESKTENTSTGSTTTNTEKKAGS